MVSESEYWTDQCCAVSHLLPTLHSVNCAAGLQRATGKALTPGKPAKATWYIPFSFVCLFQAARCVNIYKTPKSFPPLCRQSLRKGSAGTKHTVEHPSVWCRSQSSAQCTLHPVENSEKVKKSLDTWATHHRHFDFYFCRVILNNCENCFLKLICIKFKTLSSKYHHETMETMLYKQSLNGLGRGSVSQVIALQTLGAELQTLEPMGKIGRHGGHLHSCDRQRSFIAKATWDW